MNFGLWLVVGFISSLVVLYWVYDINESTLNNSVHCTLTVILGAVFGPVTALVVFFCVMKELHIKYRCHANAKRFYNTKETQRQFPKKMHGED